MTWECNIHGQFQAPELTQDNVGANNGVQCPTCGQIMSNLNDEDIDEIPEADAGADDSFGEPGDVSRLSSKRSVELEAEDIHMAKKMIQAGLGADLNDLTQKALRYYGGSNFNNVIRGDDTMMNEQLINALTQEDKSSPLETAMAASMMQNVTGGDSGGDGMDITEIMKMKMLMGEQGSSQQSQQQQNSGMDMTQLMMLEKLGGSDDDGMSQKELIQLIKEMNNDDSDGMDPAMLMMMNDDGGQEERPYKEFMEMYKQNQEQQTQLQQQVLEQKFGNELENLQRQMQGVAEQAQEAEQSDMDELLGQMEQVEKFARKLGMTESSESDGDDTAQTMERLIDTVGEHMGPAMEKYMENQAMEGGGRAQPTPNGGSSQRAQEVQQARQQAEASAATDPEPTAEDVAF